MVNIYNKIFGQERSCVNEQELFLSGENLFLPRCEHTRPVLVVEI